MNLLLADGICMIVIVVLLQSIALQKVTVDKTASRFAVLLRVVLGFLFVDLLCNVLEGKPKYAVLSYLLNTLDFIFVDGIIVAFSAYLATLVGRVDKKWKRVMNPGAFVTYIRAVLIVVLTALGKLFSIDEEGRYQEEALILIPYALLFVVLMLLLTVVVHQRRCFTKQQLVVMILYLILPIVGGVLELVTDTYVFTAVSITTSVLMIYTMVQTEIIEECRVRETVLEELSSTDLLTSLNNRRAYYNRFSTLAPHENIGVVFCDINGLKYANDNFGHAEGDKLIVRFANLLAGVFDAKNIFRISGDEFVVIVPGMTKATFQRKMEELQTLLQDNQLIASAGSSFGEGGNVEQLVSVAESAMYNRKREYYEQNHIQRGDTSYHWPIT